MTKLLYQTLLFAAVELGSSAIWPAQAPYLHQYQLSARSSPPPLALSVFLNPCLSDPCRFSITITYPQDISIKWNSHLHSRAEHGAFEITYKVNKSTTKLGIGPNMLTFNFVWQYRAISSTSPLVANTARTSLSLKRLPFRKLHGYYKLCNSEAFLQSPNTTLYQAQQTFGRWAQKLPTLKPTYSSTSIKSTKS